VLRGGNSLKPIEEKLIEYEAIFIWFTIYTIGSKKKKNIINVSDY